MYILAIETSCDETSCAILKNGRQVLSNVVLSQIDEHKLYGGVVPEVASRMHIESIYIVCEEALSKAGLTIKNIDFISATFSPGLIGALLVGFNFAKSLSYANNIPFVPVHHIRGHIASNYICHKDLKPPFLSLVVSGGHSHLIYVEDYTKFKIYGQTVDDAVGEVYDKIARVLGFSYPGGVVIDKIANDAKKPQLIEFPTPKLNGKYDFSFSGIKTFALNYINSKHQKNEDLDIESFCFSFQNKAVNILVDKTINCAKEIGVDKIVLAGGVSANSFIRKKIKEMSDLNNLKLFLPDIDYCGDNAAMIGCQGYYEFLDGNISKLNKNAEPNLPVDYNLSFK
ncbi:MAG: tRNA (adenosine(37)-N6)-threonylcarbamoyltransferase complex transferase subunit TsaD [Oscillospiraceae bacterium]